MRDRRVPLRKNLLVRLLATSILVAVCSVAATAWLATKTTTTAIQQEQGQSLSEDTTVYDTLIGYAATHRSWDGVRPIVAGLARRTGWRIAVATQAHKLIIDSDRHGLPLPPKASAVVDPLRVNSALASESGADYIDARAVGPFMIPEAERPPLTALANSVAGCLRDNGMPAQIVVGLSGRPSIRNIDSDPTGGKITIDCQLTRLENAATPTEQKALTQLNNLVNDCLGGQGLAPIHLNLNRTWLPRNTSSASPGQQMVRPCLDLAQRQQLLPYVAPVALLFIAHPRPVSTGFDLSKANTTRIVWVTALILLLAIFVTVVVGIRLVRPLRALTLAAQHPTDHHIRVPVTSTDEIGLLTAAFNDMSERRELAEQQRKTLVSDVAHELGTPLTNIRSWLEAAQDGVAQPDEALIALLLEEALLLQHVIDDLRDLAAADVGGLRVYPEQVFVNDLLYQAAAAHHGRAEAAGVQLTVETAGDPELAVDPARLRQMVGNLTSNAIRYTAPGGTVTIRSRLADGQLAVDVSDTGTGIDPKDLPHVFDRFWRADKSRTRHTGGSGLGLAIVQHLAEAHGGTIGVTSVPGTGTVFTLLLPAVTPVG